ncbi:hypothetical protein U1Q18_041172 [Sarracenia purpurea var. burkii]
MAGSATKILKKKTPYTVAALSFISLLLLAVLVAFTKRALNPTLSHYTNLYYSSRTPITLPASLLLPPPPADSLPPSPEPTASSSPPPLSSSIEIPNSSSEPDDSGLIEEKKIRIEQREAESGSESDSGNVIAMVDDEAEPHSGNVSVVALCDLYVGSWVKVDGYPLYRPGTCPYVDEAFDCQSNGRPDSEYMKWRWKPDGCELPRWKFLSCF